MNRPVPPPEAELIRLVREAAHITTAEAAVAAGMSKSRWSQIESGYETRGEDFKEVRGKRDTIAHMAHVVGIGPERLEEAGRPDAAEVLREIQRQEAAAVLPPVTEEPPVVEDDPLTPDERAASEAFIAELRRRRAQIRAREERERQEQDRRGNGKGISALGG